MESKKIHHVDCFSGVGGFCCGFRAGGIHTVLAIEKVKSCVDTYKANNPDVPIIHDDIRNVKTQQLKKDVKNCVDVVTAGMPCETFSTAGSKSRSFYDHRQFLFTEAIRVASVLKAPLILFENVPAITTKTTHKRSSNLVIDELYNELAKHGYKYNITTILNSVDFGIPQERKRLFILATNKETLNLKVPVACHNGKVTVKKAFVGLPKVVANSPNEPKDYLKKESAYTKLLKDNSFWRIEKKQNNLSYHKAPKHRKTTLRRFALINPGEGLKDLFLKKTKKQLQQLQKEKILPKRWYIQRNRRLIENEPSVTVTSHCIDEIDVVNRVVSAEQSWKKSSGHAFEETAVALGNKALEKHSISLCLQRDLYNMITQDELSNQPRDIKWLNQQIQSSSFDLFAIVDNDNGKFVFGCIQAKTSIRDRVTRDREPSLHAMEAFFWSIAICLDGAFLALPKFQDMVNGGTADYPHNGWHGMYVFSRLENGGRIYHLDRELEPLRVHAKQAAEQWIKQRQWLAYKWKPKSG